MCYSAVSFYVLNPINTLCFTWPPKRHLSEEQDTLNESTGPQRFNAPFMNTVMKTVIILHGLFIYSACTVQASKIFNFQCLQQCTDSSQERNVRVLSCGRQCSRTANCTTFWVTKEGICHQTIPTTNPVDTSMYQMQWRPDFEQATSVNHEISTILPTPDSHHKPQCIITAAIIIPPFYGKDVMMLFIANKFYLHNLNGEEIKPNVVASFTTAKEFVACGFDSVDGVLNVDQHVILFKGEYTLTFFSPSRLHFS